MLLPVADSKAHRDESAAGAAETQQPDSSPVVLVVEDEEVLRHAASAILGRRGFTVLQAADGTAALDHLASAERIDFVLLDVTLPGASSRDVAAGALLAHPDAKVLLTSAYSREMAMGAFEGVSISGFIRKPYKVSELIRVFGSQLSPAERDASA